MPTIKTPAAAAKRVSKAAAKPAKPADTKPRPGKQNIGNRRTGAVKGTKSGLRRGQLPWQQDPAILARVNLVRRLMAEGRTATGMLPAVNRLMVDLGCPAVTVQTIYDDRARVKEQLAEERDQAKQVFDDAQQEALEHIRHLRDEAWRAFHEAGAASLNRSSYLNTIARLNADEAKIKGVLPTGARVTGSVKPGNEDGEVTFTIDFGTGPNAE